MAVVITLLVPLLVVPLFHILVLAVMLGVPASAAHRNAWPRVSSHGICDDRAASGTSHALIMCVGANLASILATSCQVLCVLVGLQPSPSTGAWQHAERPVCSLVCSHWRAHM
jgi:hypothetical protein